MRIIVVFPLLCLILLSCKKELPDNENDDNNPSDNVSSVTIPCDSMLISNNFSIGNQNSYGGYSSFNVYMVNGSESSNHFEILANHFQTNINLNIHVSGKPNSFLGRRIYTTSVANNVSGDKAKFFVRYGNSATFNPIEVDTIFVDYFNDSMVYSFCDVKLESSQSAFSSSTLRLKGRVVHEF